MDTCELNHIFVAHDERCAAIDHGAHGQLGLKRYADLAHKDQIEWRLKHGGDLGGNGLADILVEPSAASGNSTV